ncbi:unnamed protein product [Effrenium voratum]|nr:unnamed protein product [Effrenium voratum]
MAETELRLWICGLSGEDESQVTSPDGFRLSVPSCALGLDVAQAVQTHLGPRPGGVLRLVHGGFQLELESSLCQQDVQDESTIQCIYVPTKLLSAYETLSSRSEDVDLLEGIIEICAGFVPRNLHGLLSLSLGDAPGFAGLAPEKLQHLTLGHAFNESLEGVTLPCGLQSLTFGYAWDKELQKVTFPEGLHILSFGSSFNRRLQGAKFLQPCATSASA